MHEFVEHRLSYFSKYYDLMPFRFPTFKAALNILVQKTDNNRLILETGSQNLPDAWGGAGGSTYIFGEFCSRYGGEVHTVDISKGSYEQCMDVTCSFSRYINYYNEDSLTFLKKFNNYIDLLYLDSYDYPIGIQDNKIVLVGDPIPSQTHILKEAEIALPKLKKTSVVLIDDSNCPGGGKGTLAVNFLIKNGWTVIYDMQQTILLDLR